MGTDFELLSFPKAGQYDFILREGSRTWYNGRPYPGAFVWRSGNLGKLDVHFSMDIISDQERFRDRYAN